MSGVYGVFANGSLQRRPKQRYTVSIGFGCAPENVERLLAHEPMAPPGAACIHLAWQHREQLLDAD